MAKAKWVGGSGGKGERGRETERGVEQTTLPSSDWGVQGSLSIALSFSHGQGGLARAEGARGR